MKKYKSEINAKEGQCPINVVSSSVSKNIKGWETVDLECEYEEHRTEEK